ncbi:HET-domain-containing protein [Nemania abortiva]|nr:HET-domain-containing protein [Nemania abortiva]
MAFLGSSSSEKLDTNELLTNSTTNGSGLSSCDFCSKILTILITSDGDKVPLGSFPDAVNTDCPHARWLRVAQFCGSSGDCECEQGDLYTFREILGRMGLERYCSCNSQPLGCPTRTVAIHPVRFKDNKISRDKKYRLIRHEDTNIEYVKTWLNRCLRDHRGRCDQHIIKGLRTYQPELLIDTVRGCLSPHTPDEAPKRYLALSYVWGRPGRVPMFRTTTNNVEDLKRPGVFRSGPIANQLSKTVRNAIYLTKLLGETFLWVDSLCIVQDDDPTRERALRYMHTIYSGAVLTVVVESERHSDDGIRGIRDRTEPPNGLEGDESVKVESSAYPPTHPQDYHMRMWTFQEYIFSRRRLVFGQGPVIWECSSARWRDDVVSEPGGILPERDKGHDKYGMRSYGFRDMVKSRIPKLSSLRRIVARFNERVLTVPTDVLSSFSGIQSMLEQQLFPDGLLYGLPEFFFDIALVWDQLGTRATNRRRSPRHDFSGNPLLDDLPSWSWMGWQGTALLPDDIEFEAKPAYERTAARLGFVSPVTRWFTMKSPESEPRQPIRSQWYDFRQQAVNPLPEGWGKESFSLNLWKDKAYEIPAPPRCLPNFLYSHKSEPHHYYWYPVPVSAPLDTRENDSEARSQTQYLYCKTSRAFLYQDPLMDDYQLDQESKMRRNKGDMIIRTCRGRAVGVLWYRVEGDFVGDRQKVESVSIVKGYTSKRDLPKNIRDGQDPFSPIGDPDDMSFHDNDCSEDCDESIEADESGEDDESDEDNESNGGGIRDWEEGQAGKMDCYFVLSIYWKGGVVYRSAAGFVVADAWERYKEANLIDLILG